MKGMQWKVAEGLFGLAGAIVVLAIIVGAMPRIAGYELFFNGSPSVPRGLYWVRLGKHPTHRGDYVVFRPAPPFTALIYGRGWLPSSTPMLKIVGGLEGDVYCIEDERFAVNGVDVGPVFPRDSQGLPVPQLSGCHRVDRDKFLPVSSFLARSFDGRYMGAVPTDQVIGTGAPIWTY